LKLYSAIYFDSRGLSTSPASSPPYMPVDNNGNYSTIYDWVDAKVTGTGEQSVSLICQANPGRKVEDFFEYFSSNEVVWYKIILSREARILKIFRVLTYDLENAISNISLDPFPTYEYKFKASVSDVSITDDQRYEAYSDFSINYGIS